jgi:hypothetical protein
MNAFKTCSATKFFFLERTRMRFSIIFALFALLAGCQPPVKDINSPYYSVPVGSTLTLNKEIEIPAGHVSMYMQRGKQYLGYGDVEKYYPSCKFELNTPLKDVRQIVHPDVFTIYKVVRDTYVVQSNAVMLASIVMDGSGDGPTALTFSTIMYLRSEKQPDVFRLTCEHWDDPTDGDHLTISDIRKALGDMFTLNLVQS